LSRDGKSRSCSPPLDQGIIDYGAKNLGVRLIILSTTITWPLWQYMLNDRAH